MTIKVGDQVPQGTFFVIGPDGLEPRTTDAVFKGRRIVLVGVPGAFTPTCDRNHLPGYVERAGAIRAKGVDAIAVTSVNDAFVLRAWSHASGAEGVVEFLSDGNGDFAQAIGLTMDGTARGFGLRSQRYVMLVDDGTVKSLVVEDVPGKADLSGATALLASL